MPIYERHSSLADILNFYHLPDLSHLLMSFPQQSLQSSPRRSSQADVWRSPSSVALSDPSRNTGGIDCATVAIIVRWWCVFLKTSLEFVRWSNAALNDKISSYLQKTPWRFSPASVRTRRAIVRRMCGSSATTSNRTRPRWSARWGIREMKWDLPLSLVCARCTFPEVFPHYRWNLRSVHCRWNQTFLFSFVSLLFSMWIPPACDRSTFLNIFGQYSLWLKIY